ncbi:polysaccharide pyruvyl transferase family protein [Desulfobacter postgatei]|uniref:Exopolysaccharide biosynthesis protein n=1 Tax=Desulfobacter postgatei 2ac9 TaxID=879212 RepID=I5B263_9BACT|nr:polysaccharide pyruvyl transferase family protein [Desulfobacter postgatei]EIM63576.1 exopolysaccharide biosynthesis protein [Desulfobacter postgatei 2ac9]
MNSENNNLKTIFEKYFNYDFIFVEPGGNYGDCLIYWGAEFLASEIGLTYKRMNKDEFCHYSPKKEDIVYIHGGGGYNNWCSGSVLTCLIHALSSKASIVIQGPCTLEKDHIYISEKMVPILERFSEKEKYFFAREKTSYDLAVKYFQPFFSEIYIEKDTAFYLTKEEVLKRVGNVKPGYHLYAFRQDNEAGHYKILTKKKGVRIDPAFFCRDFNHWLRVHAGATDIVTNRTHSSIIGAILDKNTTLFPNRYHKNKSIWEYSLKKRNVYWSDGKQLTEGPFRNDIIDFFPLFLKKSYKFKHFFRFLQGVPLK